MWGVLRDTVRRLSQRRCSTQRCSPDRRGVPSLAQGAASAGDRIITGFDQARPRGQGSGAPATEASMVIEQRCTCPGCGKRPTRRRDEQHYGWCNGGQNWTAPVLGLMPPQARTSARRRFWTYRAALARAFSTDRADGRRRGKTETRGMKCRPACQYPPCTLARGSRGPGKSDAETHAR